MEKRKINEQISTLLETCIEQFEQISSYDGKIPQIEMDIILNNIRNLYENLSLLNKLNNEEKKEQGFKTSFPEKVAEQNKDEVKSFIRTEKDMQPKEVSEEKAETEKIAGPAASVIPHLESLSQKNKSAKKVANLFDSNADNEDEENEITSINEKLNKTREDSLADKLKQNKIKDLKQAIGINEKFLFINELFEGNLSDYNNAISRINSLNTKTEADAFIEIELKAKYNWNETSKAKNIFIQLIERRFS